MVLVGRDVIHERWNDALPTTDAIGNWAGIRLCPTSKKEGNAKKACTDSITLQNYSVNIISIVIEL